MTNVTVGGARTPPRDHDRRHFPGNWRTSTVPTIPLPRTAAPGPSAWPGIEGAGGLWEDAAVAVDVALVTSRWPADLPAFAAAMIRLVQRSPAVQGAGPSKTAEPDRRSEPCRRLSPFPSSSCPAA